MALLSVSFLLCAATASGGGMQPKNDNVFHPPHPHPVLGFLPSPIKLQCLALQLSWTAGPKGHRESPFPPCLYCTDRCLAWEQLSPIPIRAFYCTGIKSQQFFKPSEQKTMLGIVSSADRKECGWGCAFLTSFSEEKLLYLALFFLRNCFFLWWRST